MSNDNPFDPKKFKDELHDTVHRFKDELHDQIHRGIQAGLQPDDKQESRRRPLVVGIDLRGRGRGGIVMGAILALIGLAFLLNNMGYISVGNLWRFWPMLLVFGGLLNFISRHRAWGTVVMLAGVVLQLDMLGITHFGWAGFWPMMIIALGILMIWGSFGWSKKPAISRSSAGDPRTTLNEAVVFGGLERRMTSQDFQGGDVTAIFGGVELDLTEANMQANEATLAITAIFGGVEVRVPPSWQVAFRGAPIFGGMEDKTRTPRVDDPANPNPKTLVITGAVIFGGLEIKN
jgi:predicted membrane protein